MLIQLAYEMTKYALIDPDVYAKRFIYYQRGCGRVLCLSGTIFNDLGRKTLKNVEGVKYLSGELVGVKGICLLLMQPRLPKIKQK
ncbi:hypothetical protein DP73_17525 [Desulfosporosinus sp. HMP52]|nr:hypothetical protein DP73_17525 [Desulfosporosinus sp. HMP52]